MEVKINQLKQFLNGDFLVFPFILNNILTFYLPIDVNIFVKDCPFDSVLIEKVENSDSYKLIAIK